MNGFVRILKSDLTSKDDYWFGKSQELGESQGCLTYTQEQCNEDIDPLYCWVKLEENLVSLKLSASERSEIKTREEAIAAGMQIPLDE